jgi:hypothetical protein
MKSLCLTLCLVLSCAPQLRSDPHDLVPPARQAALEDISARMAEVQQRMAQGDSSAGMHAVQRHIVTQLDLLIRDLQDRRPASRSDREPQQNSDSDQGFEPGQSPAGRPTTGSGDRPDSGPGASVQREQWLRRAWGHLPAGLRQQLQASLPEDFLPEYSRFIEDYFRRLAEEQQ